MRVANLASFGLSLARDRGRRTVERVRAARASLAFDPGPFGDHQFLRFVHYERLERRLASWVWDRPRPRIVEFGGSNGAIAAMLPSAEYEIAPNFPDVDVQDLGAYEAESYDGVVLDQVLEHVADPSRAVREIRRLLRPGGLCLATTPFLIRLHGYPGDFHRFTGAGLSLLFHGFARTETNGWGNRYTLDVITRYGWLSATNTKRLGHVALWCEPEWPLNFLTWAVR